VTSISSPAALLAAAYDYLTSFDSRLVEEFASAVDWRADERRLDANDLACLTHLDRAAGIAPLAERWLVELLARHRRDLRWGQTYTAADFGQNFIDNYGWMELVGTRGYFASDKVAAGFLILGPDIVYPDHHHIAEELYVPLTGGTKWRKGEGGFTIRAAGEIIHHPSNISHAMRTGAEPLVAFYLWRGGPLAQKSTIVAAGQL
jgi:mannose-6-phosphate isomerase-like protein (cupin superfamily)